MIEKRFYSAAIDGNISTTFIIPVEKQPDQYAVSNKRSVNVLRWNGKDPIAYFVRDTFSVETAPIYESNNYNMAKVSPNKNFVGGTYSMRLCSNPVPNAALYNYKKCHGVKTLKSKVFVTSGMDWNIKAKLFYFVETCRYRVYEFDWYPETDEICNIIFFKKLIDIYNFWKINWKCKNISNIAGNKRVLFDFKKHGVNPEYFPLSMTIDVDGFLYVGLMLSSSIWKINPRYYTRF